MRRERLAADDVAAVTAHVHQGAIDVLGPVTDPQTVHQSKFSMGTVLALVALHGRAGLTDFDAHWRDADVAAFRDRVDHAARRRGRRRLSAALDRQGDGDAPATAARFDARIDEPKGDPGNTLDRTELEDKAQRLAAYRDGASRAEMARAIESIRALRTTARVGRLLG